MILVEKIKARKIYNLKAKQQGIINISTFYAEFDLANNDAHLSAS